jgi:hypothetical protein
LEKFSKRKIALINMWVFLSNSFLSVVADKENPEGGRLLVRARKAGHIENVFPDVEVDWTPNADYAFRARVPREEVAKAMAAEVLNLDYTNFKNSIKDGRYHDACIETWFAMNALQRGDKSMAY